MVAIIRDVLEEAIQAGGSTLKDFRHSDGELGYFNTHSKYTVAKVRHVPTLTVMRK